GLSGSIGYLTEASADLAFRWGSLDTPWWSSSPSIADYGGHPPIRLAGERASRSGPRFQFAAGVNLRLRAYNAFLQGQFRSSEVTFGASDLNHVLLEAWLGVTTVFKNNLSVTYTLRHQTEELKTGDGAREVSWASIGVAQQVRPDAQGPTHAYTSPEPDASGSPSRCARMPLASSHSGAPSRWLSPADQLKR